jgi:hypothetical protein
MYITVSKYYYYFIIIIIIIRSSSSTLLLLLIITIIIIIIILIFWYFLPVRSKQLRIPQLVPYETHTALSLNSAFSHRVTSWLLAAHFLPERSV